MDWETSSLMFQSRKKLISFSVVHSLRRHGEGRPTVRSVAGEASVTMSSDTKRGMGLILQEPFLAKQGAARRVGVRTQGGEIRDDVLDLRSIRGSSRRSDEGKKAVLQPFPGRVCLINGIGKGNDVGPKFGDGTHDVRKEVVGSRPETRRTCVRRFWEGGKGNEGLHRPNHRCGYPKNRCRKHLRHDLTSRSAYFGWSADHIRL
mmetsp:Transcript_30765/g.70397  ORF Transcript_30765/g.70397 Transcript_30765/m.70397 type:complete len:204 (-) Transcript_30765:84-695(-)